MCSVSSPLSLCYGEFKLSQIGTYVRLTTDRILAPRGGSETLTTFSSNGWSSPGVASLVGISAAIGDLIGADSSVHLSEELRNASWILPRSMIATALMNYVLGFVTICESLIPYRSHFQPLTIT
jgi:choline transport protein